MLITKKTMKHIIIFAKKLINVFKKGKTYWFDCECGKRSSIITNIYDNADSGSGSCECGKSRVYIN